MAEKKRADQLQRQLELRQAEVASHLETEKTIQAKLERSQNEGGVGANAAPGLGQSVMLL
eukprot:COSAG02_NODE_589_length_19902_cov_119.928939_15_plen_60_part_00